MSCPAKLADFIGLYDTYCSQLFTRELMYKTKQDGRRRGLWLSIADLWTDTIARRPELEKPTDTLCDNKGRS